jgi:hypothetical protein
MAEVKKKEEELTTADLASYGIPPEQTEGLKLVKGQEPETLDRVAAVSEPLPLFSESEMGDFRSQWSSLQTGFVDEPRRAVEEADKLVASVMQRLAEGFANERSGLEKHWRADEQRKVIKTGNCSGLPLFVICSSSGSSSFLELILFS